LVPVALHHAVAARDDFADGDAVFGDIVVVRVYHAEFDVGDWEAGHGLADKFLFALPVDARLHKRDGEDRRGFGEAIAGEADAAHFFFYLANERRRGGSATEIDALKAAEVMLGALGTVHQRGGHGGNRAEVVDALGFDEAEHLGGFKFLHHDVLSAKKREE